MEEENPPITLTVSHDVAVALGAAVTYYRVLLEGSVENAPTIALLDQAYTVIREHPQLSPVAKETLRDMRLVVAGQRD